MTDVMAHRGPDDRGFYQDNNAGLGHRRLSIIDLNTGRQPIYNETGSLAIVYNGETYNFQSLRNDLVSKGHVFETKTDTEIIVHLYEEYGERCVDYLRGMFAFAIWDNEKRELFLARDRFGIKPLYYTELSTGEFIFASEIKSILEIPCVKREIDETAFDQYFTFRYVPEDRTMFKAIYKLEPGHFLVYKNGKAKIEQYWDIDFDRDAPLSGNVSDIAHRLKESLRESIKIRLMSDVPLGAYLSGGLDSSFIVGLMSDICPDPVETFSIGFDDIKWNESRYSDFVASHYHTNHHRLIAGAHHIDLMHKVIRHLDEPLADAATIPTYMMSELTRRYVTVVLSGEGADELFAGYDKYKILDFGRFIRRLNPSFLFNSMSNSSLGRKNITIGRISDYLGAVKDPAHAYLQLVSVFTKRERQKLYRRPDIINDTSYEIIKKYINRFENNLHNLLYIDLKTWLPNDVLLKNDKMTMANSIEARVPFLDHLFAEESARIPASMKMKGMREKYILRKAMESVVPMEIVKRRKHGFTVPLQHWMDGGLDRFAREALSKKTIERRGYFNYDTIESLFQKSLKNIFYRRQFWSVLTFELWCQTFLDKH